MGGEGGRNGGEEGTHVPKAHDGKGGRGTHKSLKVT